MPHRHPQVTPKLTKSPLPTSVMEMLGCTQVLLRASKPGLLRKVLRNLTSSTQPIPKGPENSLWSHKNAREMDVPIKSKVWCNITSKSLQILGGSPSTLVVKPSETLYDSGGQRPNMDSWQKTMGLSCTHHWPQNNEYGYTMWRWITFNPYSLNMCGIYHINPLTKLCSTTLNLGLMKSDDHVMSCGDGFFNLLIPLLPSVGKRKQPL